MRSEYLENDTQASQGSGALGLIASLYGYSALDMARSVKDTGRFYIPWSGLAKKGGVGFSGESAGLFKAAKREMIPGTPLPTTRENVTSMMYGKKFRGTNMAGRAALLVSGGAGLLEAAMIWNDPIWWGLANIGNPLMLAAGVVRFAGFGAFKDVARAMEKARYADLSVPFMETSGSVTSRQRAVRAISESHLQARSAIGNEAQLYHR